MRNAVTRTRFWNTSLLVLLALGLAACAGNTPNHDPDPGGGGGGAVVTGVAVTPDGLTLEVGQSQLLTASVSGTGNFDTTVTWGSSDENVATVNADGRVTGVAAGTTGITASSTSAPSVQDTVQVTVSAGPTAECKVPGQPVDIPDDGLRNRLLDILDADEVTECELARVERISGQNHGILNLEGLQYATGLRELDMMLNLITDLSPIAGLSLEVLKLGANPITDLAPLSGMISLRELQVEGIAGLVDLGPLVSLVNLELLLISNTGVTDLSVLESFTKLNRLAVGRHMDGGPSDFSVLTRLPELATLYVVHLPEEDLGLLRAIPKLTDLQLVTVDTYTNVSDLADLTQLESLRVKLPGGTELSMLGGMTGLVRLDVSDSFVTDLSPLLPMMQLKWLDVRRNCLPADLEEDTAFSTLVDRGVEVLHNPQRASGC